MRVVWNSEYGLIFYRDKLQKFNNNGKMIMNIIDCERYTKTPKIHPTQKPVKLLEKIIKIFTDIVDVVIDPVSGSGTTLLSWQNLKRNVSGFEIKKEFHKKSTDLLIQNKQRIDDIDNYGFAKTELEKI